MWSEWMDNASAVLPGCDDALLMNVWSKNLLLFDKLSGIGDSVDYESARLVAAALIRREQLLITLPDFKPHRPAFLFVTALIRLFLDSRRQVSLATTKRGPVLYFGANIGIREQLSRTSIKGLGIDLAQVFSQQDIHRGATSTDDSKPPMDSAKVTLPHVITVYSPVDPIEILKGLSPSLIAIDCGDVKSLSWLQPLLKEAVRCRIPIVAWNQNPLSECVADFISSANAFIWPPNICSLSGKVDVLLNSYSRTNISPFLLHGSAIDEFSVLMHEAKQLLICSTQYANNRGRLESDAVAIHWKYFRSIETLSVPADFYEAESSRFWGLQPIKKLATVCSHFRSVLMTDSITTREYLVKIGVILEKAYSILQSQCCPLWEACVNTCIEDPENQDARLLVFASDSRKKIFLFALLARYNTTEIDLQKMMIRIVSLNELRRYSHPQYKTVDSDISNSDLLTLPNELLHPILVGLPSLSMTPQLFYVIIHPIVDIILYPHQYSSFRTRQADWSYHLGGNFIRNTNTLSLMAKKEKPKCIPLSVERISISDPIEIDIETMKKKPKSLNGQIWQPEDTIAEVSRLFQDDEFDNEKLFLYDQSETSSNTTSVEQSKEIWCSEAYKVKFEQGWYVYFAPDDLINIISGVGLESRYVRSLRNNERVLIIHGQQRQSLYDLIISRVHNHPSIELHIAMISRWQEDLRVAYEQWRSLSIGIDEFGDYGYRDIDGLYRRMKGCGSHLASSFMLNYWIKGMVLCPNDPEDLYRVATILNMDFVKKYYRHISQAASRLRGLHISLSSRLNRWLQDQAKGMVRKEYNDIIDSELGLTFEDVRNSLLILRVENIEKISGPFMRSTLGSIKKEDYHE